MKLLKTAMTRFRLVIPACLALALAACGGEGDLFIDRPGGGGQTLELAFPAGQAEDHRLPFRVSGGVPPYSSSIEGCPDWVTLFSDQGTLAGTAPEAESGRSFFCTYRVTDSGGLLPPQSASWGLRLLVTPPASPPELSLPRPHKVSLAVGAFHSAVLPAASGGVPPYRYVLSCVGGALPPGMGFGPETRTFSGTPEAPFRDSCTYSVTDSSVLGTTISRAVEVEIAGPSIAPLGLDVISKLDLSVGAFHSEWFPAASGGVGPYAYSFACAGGALPSGMGFAPETRMLAGTPEARFRDSCTYSATDSASPAVTVSRAVEIEVSSAMSDLSLPPPSRIALSVGALSVGMFHGEPLPEATGGVRPYTYALTCAGGTLPPGMSFAPATRVLAGTPQARFRDSCTYSATDSASPAVTVSRAVEIEVRSAMSDLSLPPPSRIALSVGALSVGMFHGEPLPVATGGVRPYTYALTCAGGSLPPGMSFAPQTRMFAGTPQARFRDSCTYSVTDSAMPATTFSRAVEIEVSSAMSDLSLPPPSRIALSVGMFHGEPLPAATGGVRPYTYALTCAGGSLPPGMSFAPQTRMFAGTPQARFRDSCTYSVTDSAMPATTFSRAVEIEVSSAMSDLSLPDNVVVDGDDPRSLTVQQRVSTEFARARGGVAPYTYEIVGCELPEGLAFSPESRILSGTARETYRGPDCTYRVTDSASPPVSVSGDFELIVDPLDRGRWRFRTRTVAPGGPCALRSAGISTPVAILPHAQGGTAGLETYALIDFPDRHFLSFDPRTRRLTYTHPSADPILGTPNTYRYLVGAPGVDAATADDALCLDIEYSPGPSASCPADPDAIPPLEPDHFIHVQLRVRDDAYWDENAGTGGEYRCPDAPPEEMSLAASVSNPVHEALGPVHARRAADVAHGAVRDRVRGWSPGAPRVHSAITPAVGIASLSGRNEGFDYDGSSESGSVGAELGAGSWQAGAVAAYTRTELDYRADASLSGRGYRAGEHDTEIFSLHPFAAWHLASGGRLWATLGAGAGRLSHRDAPAFPSRSRSDLRLLTHAAGGSLPLADILSGELRAEAGMEAFALEIEGGGRISSSLPTMRGRDWRAGLAWSAPVPGAPSLSMAYRQLTGDGPEGGQLETAGSVSFEGVLDPRLTLTGGAGVSFGLGDHEQESWRLGGGMRFAPGGSGRGFALDLDTRLLSAAGGVPSGIGIRGEAGYGLWGGRFLGTVRPHVGVVRHSGDGSVRRSLGLDLRDTPDSRVGLEVYDRSPDRSRGARFTLRHRF